MSMAEERLANDPTSELWGEHRARYRFAAVFAANKTVVDLACGAGFGLRMLHQAGARAIGLDYDWPSLRDVQTRHAQARLSQADATRLPLRTGAVDLVVSFETLEHVSNAALMVTELRRVIKPAGRLILSTPNKAFGPPAIHQHNPFHIQEFTGSELRQLLCRSFDRVQLFGQLPSSNYRYVPFLLFESKNTPFELLWKFQTRMPFPLKNRLSLALTGRPFYPDDTAYQFVPDRWAESHVLVAIAE